MSHSRSLRSYADVKEIFDKAVEMNGAAVVCKSVGQAVNLRARLNHFRALDRESMSQIYTSPDDPKHGTSVYDPFIVRVVNNYLTIEPREIGGYTIEPLPKLQSLGDIPPEK